MPKPPKAKYADWLHQPISIGVRSAMAAVTSLPPSVTLPLAQRAGRIYANTKFNRRHMKRAVSNLSAAFPAWSADRVRACAVATHEHLLRLGLEIAYAPRLLSEDSWLRHLTLSGVDEGVRALLSARPCILITGHCGNWELLGYTMALLGFPAHALYRPLDNRPLDHWLRDTRERRGLVLVDKFGALKQLPELLAAGAPICFVADQNGGDRGLMVPFFNRLTSTYKSIGLLALQFSATIICGFSRRKAAHERRPDEGLGFSMEVADVFGPADWAGHADPLYYLTARYRRALEMMIRKAPEQYLWMHRFWRSRPIHERLGKPFPAALRERIETLPWMTGADVEQVVDHSARDAAELAATGRSRLS
ncbi:MAG: lysophospholipid acyltransferase family protein [Phycisphaerales bacterium]|nr:lysophospholipid acyltransferase family protein [Phycisphaerales bacterium]